MESTAPSPVDLPALPRNGIPPWPATGDGITPGLVWILSAHPERVRDASDLAVTPEGLVAAGALTHEGLRVVVRLPQSLDIRAYQRALNSIAMARQPLIVIGTPAQVALLLVPGWFAAAGSAAGENAALLASALGHEWPTLIGAGTGGTPWPGGAYEPGTGRWLREGPGPVRMVTALHAVEALGQPGPVWQQTSLAPAAIGPGQH